MSPSRPQVISIVNSVFAIVHPHPITCCYIIDIATMNRYIIASKNIAIIISDAMVFHVIFIW
jgi:hypothetical protein